MQDNLNGMRQVAANQWTKKEKKNTHSQLSNVCDRRGKSTPVGVANYKHIENYKINMRWGEKRVDRQTRRADNNRNNNSNRNN